MTTRKQDVKKDSQERYITEYFANGGRKQAAATAIGVSYSTVKLWFANDAEFRERVEEFRDMWKDNLRAVALKRASEKSDTLLIFLLKSLAPEEYDDEVRRMEYAAKHNLTQLATFQVPTIVLNEAPVPAVVGDEPEHFKAH